MQFPHIQVEFGGLYFGTCKAAGIGVLRNVPQDEG